MFNLTKFIYTTLIALFIVSSIISGCKGSSNNVPEASIPTAAQVPLPFFTVLPISETDFKGFVPLGNLNPSGHTFPTDHHYFYLTDCCTTKYPVYSPGHVWITQVSLSEHVTDGYSDYSITLNPCQEVYGILGHVSELSASLLDQIGAFPDSGCSTYSTGGKTYRMCSKDVMIEVAAGIEIGKAGGNPGQYALDFGVYDTRVSQSFVNPGRFSQARYLYGVSAIDYFSSGLQTILENRAGNSDGTIHRTIAPIGGTIVNDVAGTIQGLWFKPGQPTYPEDPHLALVFDNVDPTKPCFSVGTSQVGLGSGVYSFTPTSSGTINRQFNQVTADGTLSIYQDFPSSPGTVILVQLINDSQLRVEKQTTSDGPPWAFTVNAVDYER
jgi:hypothetical protein